MRRLLLLTLCIALGSLIGAVGQHFTGKAEWFLAIPALVLLVWLFVADPVRCLPYRGEKR